METFLIILSIITVTSVIIAGTLRLGKTEEAKRIKQVEDDLYNNTNEIITSLVTEHRKVLALKYVQLRRTDDYGVADLSAYDDELGRFYDRVVRSKLLAANIRLDRDDAILHIALTVEEVAADDIDAIRSAQSTFREDMAGVEYEEMVATILAELKWNVTGTATTGDQGVDLIAEKDGRRVAIQCKRYTKAVGNKAVQEAAAGARHYGCDEAWVVSNAGFTPAAKQLAQSADVALLHHGELADA